MRGAGDELTTPAIVFISSASTVELVAATAATPVASLPLAVEIEALPVAVRAPADKAFRRARRRAIIRRFGMHVVGTGVCCFMACFFIAPMVALLFMTMGKRNGLMGEERAAVVIPSLVVALCSVTGVAATVYLLCAMLLVCLTAEESSPTQDAMVAPQPTVIAEAETAVIAIAPVLASV